MSSRIAINTSRRAFAERSWPEEFHLENGHYECICVPCGGHFAGHKDRVVCKVCSEAGNRRRALEAGEP